MSDLLIYLFSLREPTHTKEILDPITKDTLYISCLFNHISCSPNSKEKINDVKKERDDPKVMVYPKKLWDKRKEAFAYKRLVPKSKGVS